MCDRIVRSGKGNLSVGERMQMTLLSSTCWRDFTSHHSLYGTLPPEWGAMTQLLGLQLHNNLLTGSLPPQWVAMSKLEQLYIDSNQLTGSLPPQWSAMPQLVELELHKNHLNGSLPPQWGAMPKLERLHLGDNEITGSLPPEWGKMTQIREIRLHNNTLTGPLPSEWSNMTQLALLLLNHNSLSGSLAPCLFPLWNWSFMGDYNFDFSNNKFSGRLRLPCLNVDPCMYRLKLNGLVLKGNHLCGICSIECQCNKTENTAIDSPSLYIVRALTSSQCCATCAGYPKCVAAVYYSDNSNCELKNVTSPTVAMPNAEVLVL